MFFSDHSVLILVAVVVADMLVVVASIIVVIQRKLRLFGHICRMDDSRKIKTLVFGMMDG